MSEEKINDFFCIAATTSGRVRIGFEGGDFKRCSVEEAETVLEILSDAIRHAKTRHVCPGCGCDDTEEIEGAWNDWCNNCETHFYFENVDESHATKT